MEIWVTGLLSKPAHLSVCFSPWFACYCVDFKLIYYRFCMTWNSGCDLVAGKCISFPKFLWLPNNYECHRHVFSFRCRVVWSFLIWINRSMFRIVVVVVFVSGIFCILIHKYDSRKSEVLNSLSISQIIFYFLSLWKQRQFSGDWSPPIISIAIFLCIK